ncbi:MATE family efflux transporter [Bacillus atrophaeus]|uniref:MATE family efflux transporter n=1 Tax=Bacillus atrophaeus TaxID=1452 RepID=UPI002E1A7C8B|nr:MATE family efflux transporter [Bacillus atrophaeus]MED4858531.1 MATE family efflux transporter [Bacillus atrophaeus]
MNINYLKQISKLSLPIFVSSSTSILLGLVDTILIGRTDVSQLAGVSGGAAVFSLFTSIVTASLVSNQVFSAKYFGENRLDKVYNTMVNNFIFSIFIALISSVIILTFSPYFFSLIGNNSLISKISYLYLAMRLPELFFLVPLLLLKDLFSSYKKTKYILFSSLFINITNVIFSYILIYGISFFPRMGAYGAGLGSSLATLCGLIFMYIIYKRENIYNNTKINYRINFKKILEVQKFCLPVMSSATFDYIVNLIIFGLLGIMGSIYLAGGRIAFQLDMLIFTLSMSLSIGGNILVGRAWGEGKEEDIKRIFSTSILFLCVIILVPSLVFIIFPNNILGIFTNIPELISITKNSVVLIGISAPIIALSCVLSGTLRSLGKTKNEMYANLIPIWFLQLPFAYFLGVRLGHNLDGVYVGFLFYWIGRCLMSICFINVIFKKQNYIKSESLNEQQ